MTGDNIPGNTNTHEIDLNNGGWIVIAILILIIIALTVILIVMYNKMNVKINLLQKHKDNKLTNEELQILTQFAKLNNNSKNKVAKILSQNTPDEPPEKDG